MSRAVVGREQSEPPDGWRQQRPRWVARWPRGARPAEGFPCHHHRHEAPTLQGLVCVTETPVKDSNTSMSYQGLREMLQPD